MQHFLQNLVKNISIKNEKHNGSYYLILQGGFIAGHHILDNIIIVQESIHSNVERKKQGMAIKLDMENAFDRVNHFFLFEFMSKFGFSKRFVNG